MLYVTYNMSQQFVQVCDQNAVKTFPTLDS